ncbi:MAG: hypothetical protein VYD34_03515 [Verrucomicrobiota bacterium]|nr:hypothetical protein [Verrucomicrobiota bacterium]MEE2813373.1 hypothetical protein [Verrucomicrobiota bacterium]
METTLQSSKPATTQDAVLGMVSTARGQEDGEQFGKVFEDASQKLESEDHDASNHTEEDEDKVGRETKPTSRKLKDMEVMEGSAGLVRAVEIQSESAKKVVKSEAGQSQQVVNEKTAKPQTKQGEVKENTSNTEAGKAEAELKKQQKLVAAQKRFQAKEHSAAMKADQAKADQVREQNGPLKSQHVQQANVTPSLLKPFLGEGQVKDGTQVAPSQDNMLMPAKQSAMKPEAKPVLVEELRPATAADTAPRSGNQQANQDLPRESAKEQTLPVAPVQNTTPAVTGTASNQPVATPGSVVSPMLEKIWNAVTTFRIRGENEMVVKVQPDSNTEMQLTIKYGAGGVEIEARMQQGDGRQLASGWNELQQQLSERGVNLGELLSDDSENRSHDSNARQFNQQNQQAYDPSEFEIRDDQADWEALGMATTREREKAKSTEESTDKVEEAYDGWQSWA